VVCISYRQDSDFRRQLAVLETYCCRDFESKVRNRRLSAQPFEVQRYQGCWLVTSPVVSR
jgi:hypothetical protein